MEEDREPEQLYAEGHRLLKRNDYEGAFVRYQQLAKLGREESYLELGWMYSTGNGTKQNFEKAEHWYLKAAGSEYWNSTSPGTAEWYLGRIYGKTGRFKESFEWYERSAQRDYGPALSRLANIYHFGTRVPRDKKKSFALYKRGYENGNLKAQSIYARYLMCGYEGAPGFFKGLYLWFNMIFVAPKIIWKDFDDIRLRY